MTAEPPRGSGLAGLAELSDRQLLSRHVSGDPDAFGVIVRRHRDRLWAVALRTLGDPEEAADAVQDALISALRAAAGYRGDAEVTTWLHRVVVNACLDRVRYRRSRPTVPLPEDDYGVPAGPDPIARRELAVVLTEALATLPEDQRAAIVLVDVQGYSIEAAAQILDCPTGTVKSRCARGRLRLRPLLASVRGGPGAAGPHGNQSDAGRVAPGPRRATEQSGGGDQP